jgi:hypothetical protein
MKKMRVIALDYRERQIELLDYLNNNAIQTEVAMANRDLESSGNVSFDTLEHFETSANLIRYWVDELKKAVEAEKAETGEV